MVDSLLVIRFHTVFSTGWSSMTKLSPSNLVSTFKSLSMKGSTVFLNLDGMVISS